mgnify:CR=1 FL=1
MLMWDRRGQNVKWISFKKPGDTGCAMNWQNTRLNCKSFVCNQGMKCPVPAFEDYPGWKSGSSVALCEACDNKESMHLIKKSTIQKHTRLIPEYLFIGINGQLSACSIYLIAWNVFSFTRNKTSITWLDNQLHLLTIIIIHKSEDSLVQLIMRLCSHEHECNILWKGWHSFKWFKLTIPEIKQSKPIICIQ